MKRRPFSLALAVAIGLIALSMLNGAAADASGGSNGAPNSLTHHFPLGSQTLAHTKTAPAGGSATTRHRATSTPPHGGSVATRPRPAQRVRGHGGSSVLFLLAIPVLMVVLLVSRAAIRRSHRTLARRRPILRGARSTYQNSDELEREPPPLPIRSRTK